ncbi:thioredoxin domain-containing protein 11 [Neodiprion pinetum]|uniref:Thioredoxin domain-containing protein 11 n=1 Tax=Neodiprion lecontei TaxID=441921 RepID=A0A6J0C3U4_NEOLC|nr:thioredoxin domain-containing protein 11 [Neodiprion lecontei]XP_046466991.1 thioredoxin domain-containing protein 11 [Neodiprion pinetum]
MTSGERDTSPQRNGDNLRPTNDSGSDNVVQTSLATSSALEERLASKMLHYGKELCFFAAILFTTLAALHTSPPKVSQPPSARPFFNQSSLVLDFYKGHLGAAIERVTDADLSFVMYYAPWDAESQAVRQEFETVARFYHKQIFFAAINCWHPGSECRAEYSKIQSYPVFMLYPRRGPGVQYRGIRTAPYMIRFLHAFMNPIFRITDRNQLLNLIVDYDAVVIGYFNFIGLKNSPGYNVFYKTAIKSLERDPNKELAFAVVTDTSAESNYGVTEFPSARLLLWNESLSYPVENEWKSDSLLKWIGGALHQATLWLQPPGTKSLTLAPYLKDGPVLFLFTPRNPFHQYNYYYNLLKAIGVQYYNCGDNLMIKNIVNHLESVRPREKAKHYEKSKQCMRLLDRNRVQQLVPKMSITDRQWINSSCCSQILTNKCLMCKKTTSVLLKNEDAVCAANLNSFHHSCKPTDVFNIPTKEGEEHEKNEFCCENYDMMEDLETSTLTEENDLQTPNALSDYILKDECRHLLTGNNYHPPVFPKNLPRDHQKINLTSSICKTNKTLALIAVDSLQFFHIAEGLGIDVAIKKDKTAVAIVDPLQESQYILEQAVSYNSLVQFINNYTENSLKRYLCSHSRLESVKSSKTQQECSVSENSVICVPELTTDTFLNTVMNPDKDVVVMYHSPYCAFCHAVSYVYLTVAQYLHNMQNLTFVRINGDGNDLPWEYTMNRYPAILFFPAKRKADSIVFPFSLPISIPNFLNFVLANLDGNAHIEALVNICHLGIGDSPADCVSQIRLLCLEIIEDLLQSYRRLRRSLVSATNKTVTSKKLKVLLLRLQHIKEIHLTLGSISDLRIDEDKVILIRNKFKSYYQELSALDIDNSVDRKVVSDKHVNISNVSKLGHEL